MAADFTISDVERILKALLPDNREDPLATLEDSLLALREDFGEWTEDATDRFDSLEARTFGILILQVIKTVKTIFGLLPAGRVILIAITVLGLISAYLEDGTLSIDTAKNVIKESGLGDFINEKLKTIQAEAEVLAEGVRTTTIMARDSFVALAGDTEAIESRLHDLLHLMDQAVSSNAAEPAFNITSAAQQWRTYVELLIADMTPVATLANNADVVIGPVLASIEERIREIPQIAKAMVE